MEIEDEVYLTEIAPIVGDRIKLKKNNTFCPQYGKLNLLEFSA